MPGQGDDYLRSVLGGEPVPEVETAVGGGAAPGGGEQASGDITREVEDARLDAESDLGRVSATGSADASAGLTGVAASVGVGGTSGGHFRFSAEELDAKIRQLEDMKRRMEENAQTLGRAARSATPPSHDPPAVEQARRVQVSTTSAQQHAAAMADYAGELIRKLNLARGRYTETEDAASDALRQTSNDEGDSGANSGIYGG